jgi:hypothetical protein
MVARILVAELMDEQSVHVLRCPLLKPLVPKPEKIEVETLRAITDGEGIGRVNNRHSKIQEARQWLVTFDRPRDEASRDFSGPLGKKWIKPACAGNRRMEEDKRNHRACNAG